MKSLIFFDKLKFLRLNMISNILANVSFLIISISSRTSEASALLEFFDTHGKIEPWNASESVKITAISACAVQNSTLILVHFSSPLGEFHAPIDSCQHQLKHIVEYITNTHCSNCPIFFTVT